MDIKDFMKKEGELPLDNLVSDGGFAKIFRTVGCIGDSLSSGEFESFERGEKSYHDMYEYSWGQFMAREAGFKAINFSQGGLTAGEFINDYFAPWGVSKTENLCQAYIIALGVNDLANPDTIPFGSIEDINRGRFSGNKNTFCGNYGKIIQRLIGYQPKAKIFLMSIPREENEEKNAAYAKHAAFLYELEKMFPKNVYVIDLYKYAPIYDKEFKKNFFLGGHMNPQGYVLTAKMVLSYIDYIIRNNPEDFATVPFINTPFYN
jgi:lysophospholipase L1-like esterase